MRQFAFLTVGAVVLAAPVSAQVTPATPLPAIDGGWTMTRNTPGGTTSVHLDLVQRGSSIAGRERIVTPGFAVTLQLSGEVTGDFGGVLSQTSVEQLSGLPNFCLQTADFSMTSANRLSVRLKPSERCESEDAITLTRDAPGSVRYTASPNAPSPPTSFSGVWMATLRNLRAGPVNIRLDLTQNGHRIAGQGGEGVEERLSRQERQVHAHAR